MPFASYFLCAGFDPCTLAVAFASRPENPRMSRPGGEEWFSAVRNVSGRVGIVEALQWFPDISPALFESWVASGVWTNADDEWVLLQRTLTIPFIRNLCQDHINILVDRDSW